MYQQEIKFFWPLTEQIPLDLDYSECSKKSSITFPTNISTGCTVTFNTPAASWVSTDVSADGITTPNLTLKLDKQPNFIVRWLYKLLNIKWKINGESSKK